MLSFLPNDRKILDGLELDIYMPGLRMAIEWNGIHHHMPIYGDFRLEMTKINDAVKKKMCQEKGIHLVTIQDFESKEKQILNAYRRICFVLDRII